MFNVNRFLSRPQKFILEQNFKSYLNDSVNKFNKLTIEINEDVKRKNEIQKILYGNTLNKTNNHLQYDLINNYKYHNLFFIVSVVSTIGAFIFFKSKQ
jgi:hypothetical protein